MEASSFYPLIPMRKEESSSGAGVAGVRILWYTEKDCDEKSVEMRRIM